MTTTPAAQGRQMLILASGAFGSAVTDRLGGLYETTVQNVDAGTHPSMWPYADLMILSVSHERPRIAAGLDQASFAWGVPWLEICLEPTEVRVGPVVVPGRTACYACFLRRRAQHRRVEPTSAGTDKHPTGFAAHHVGIAAAFARQAVCEVFAPDPEALGGTVRRFNLVSGATSRSAVVATDRCARCRRRHSSEGLWRELAQAGKEDGR
jgi:bacteriocin biosynthesis cyclodehydratase domain-containing protein